MYQVWMAIANNHWQLNENFMLQMYHVSKYLVQQKKDAAARLYLQTGHCWKEDIRLDAPDPNVLPCSVAFCV